MHLNTKFNILGKVTFTFFFILLASVYAQQAHAGFWGYQLQNANPSELVQVGRRLSVIDYSNDGSDAGQYSFAQIQSVKDAGGNAISYLSIGEAESYRFYWDANWVNDDTNSFTGNEPSWFGHTNPDWIGNYKIRYWDTDWRDNYLAPYLDRIIAQGFNGVYLDIVDAYEYWADEDVYSSHGGPETRLASDPFGNEGEAASRMLDLIEWIKDYSHGNGAEADFKIIPQNGEGLLNFDKARYLSLIDGIGVEDLWYDETNLQTDFQERLDILNQILAGGLDVFSVDYVDDGGASLENIERIQSYIALCHASGFDCYPARTDRELDEANDYISRANLSAVPLPAAFWLFGSALFGMVGIARRKKF